MTNLVDVFNNRPFQPTSTISIGNNLVPYLNDDNPKAAYDGDPTHLKFVAQPLCGSEINKLHGVVTIPLMMTDEWAFAKLPLATTDIWRGMDKRFDYMFVGQTQYAGRQAFRDLHLDSYNFRETSPVYNLRDDDKEMALLDFLTETAEARFVFAPRGVGSSSFRAYQAMMVGSVPIITGMEAYPFEDEVDWDTFSIRGDLKDLDSLIEKSKQIDFDQFSQNAIDFWEKYCKHDMLYSKLRSAYFNHSSKQHSEINGAD